MVMQLFFIYFIAWTNITLHGNRQLSTNSNIYIPLKRSHFHAYVQPLEVLPLQYHRVCLSVNQLSVLSWKFLFCLGIFPSLPNERFSIPNYIDWSHQYDVRKTNTVKGSVSLKVSYVEPFLVAYVQFCFASFFFPVRNVQFLRALKTPFQF